MLHLLSSLRSRRRRLRRFAGLDKRWNARLRDGRAERVIHLGGPR